MTTTTKHIAYEEWRGDWAIATVYCGDWGAHGTILCDKCEAETAKRYPQGWRYYPGDVCQHGVYTGGCGIDWMCQACEDGD